MKRLKAISFFLLAGAILLCGYAKFRQIRTDEKIAPVIRMDEKSISVSVEDGDDVLLSGITAADDRDGDVTDSLIVDSLSDFTEDGKRYLTVAAFDSNNNIGKATRVITYTDYTIPRYEFLEPMCFASGDTDYLENVSVTDCLDGDISSKVRFADNTQITADEAGDYKVVLQVQNSAGDTEMLPCTLEVTDSGSYGSAPDILLKKYIIYVKKGKKVDYKKNIDSITIGGQEYDLVGGNAIGEDSVGRDRIKISDHDVNYEKAGVYEATYSLTTDDVVDPVTGKTRLVIVVED